ISKQINTSENSNDSTNSTQYSQNKKHKKIKSQSKSLGYVDTSKIFASNTDDIENTSNVNNISSNTSNLNTTRPYSSGYRSLSSNNEYDNIPETSEAIDEGNQELVGGRETITLFQTVCLGITEVEQVKLMINSINNLIE